MIFCAMLYSYTLFLHGFYGNVYLSICCRSPLSCLDACYPSLKCHFQVYHVNKFSKPKHLVIFVDKPTQSIIWLLCFHLSSVWEILILRCSHHQISYLDTLANSDFLLNFQIISFLFVAAYAVYRVDVFGFWKVFAGLLPGIWYLFYRKLSYQYCFSSVKCIFSVLL